MTGLRTSVDFQRTNGFVSEDAVLIIYTEVRTSVAALSLPSLLQTEPH
jgi:hypothetical protein